ncbi:MAG: biotin/lipoyl-binding protein [Bacteroidales bacterium]|jgi:biotin carboxyl carrier protein|nr:biotin/lipoyl-binding protein [Bacteroidales bacterium]
MKEYKFKLSGKDYIVSVDNVEDNIVNLTVNGKQHTVELEKQETASVAPVARPVAAKPVETTSTSSQNNDRPLKSPLPGVVLDIYVKTGDTVKNGQKVLLLEAMKMENNIDSDRDGIVKEIRAAKGDSVNEGDTLIIIG